MGIGVPRWIRSVRRRPAAFVVMLLLAAGATLICATTPILVQAVDAATLRDGFAHARFPQDGFTISSTTNSNVQAPQPADAVTRVAASIAASGDLWTTRQVDVLQFTARLVQGRKAPLLAGFSIAPSNCAGMRVTGRCPANVLEALLPSDLVASTGWRQGTKVQLKVFDESTGKLFTIGTVLITGVYDDASGIGAALADPTLLVQQASAREVPDFVVGDAESDGIGADRQTIAAVRVDRPVDAADLPALHRALAVVRREGLASDLAQGSGEIGTELGGLLDSIAQQQAAATVIATPVEVAAVLLAWAGLGLVAQRSGRARALEWGLARMRGARRRAWLGTVFAEPVAAVLLGTAVGCLLAPLLAAAGIARLLGGGSGSPAVLPSVGLGAALALGGSAVALAAASLRGGLAPLSTLVQARTESKRASRAVLMLQVALVVLAAAALWATLTTERIEGRQLGLLLPGLLALAAGVVAGRAAVVLVGAGARRRPRTLAGLVVGRGLARAPSALLSAQLLLVGVAVSAYAVQLVATSTTEQTAGAELATGASEVLTVRPPAGSSLLDEVDRADPTGRAAMAAEQLTDGGPSGGVLAVDTARVAAVADWDVAWRRGVDLHRLRPEGRDLRLQGSTVAVEIGDASQRALGMRARTAVELRLTVAQPGRWVDVDLGPVRDGVVRAAIPCAAGCRVVALTMQDVADPAVPWRARLTVSALSTDRQPAAALAPWLSGARWRTRIADQTAPTPSATASPVRSSAGLVIDATDRTGSAAPQVEPSVGPAVIPVVAPSRTVLTPARGIPMAVLTTSLSGGTSAAEVVGRAAAVPRTLRTGVVVDLATALQEEDPALTTAVQQVWLAPGDHAAVLARLKAQGVAVLGVERAAETIAAGLRGAPNRAVLVSGFIALVGLLFGLLAFAGTRTIDMGERRRDWRALRLTGARPSALRRLASAQIALPAAGGVLLGVVVGAAVGLLLGARLPLLDHALSALPFGAAPAVPLLAAVVVAVTAVVTALALLLARVEVRAGRAGSRA